MKELQYKPKFLRQFKKLSPEIQILAVQKIRLLRKDLFLPELKTHKLKGRFDGVFSFSVDFSHRIIFHLEEGSITLLCIGTHKIYKI
ncbi:type II toxin-antitoxin system mRNA interferase toxin, RelE/StbE family [Candidatus Gracilibacteria bacterium]|nr:type II toxin-antitoxin system mRNA interferase toxin, RelE/StbE family [Candidatus Gracilibacteria bacterium]